MRKVALKSLFLDRPNSHHKTHDEPIPYLGGVAIITGVCTTIYVALFTQSNFRNEIWLATSVLIPALILGVVGLIDDYRSLPALTRFVFQSLAGIFTATLLILTNSVGNPTKNLLLDVAITVIWIVGITNSVNFLDNLDGGAAGALAATSLGLLIITHQNGQYFLAATSVTIFGSLLGFLVWNKSPAKIYMGDAGALFLGTLISVLAIRLDPDVESQTISLSIPALLFAVPILDTSVAVISRIRRRISIFQGGRDHLSHRLLRRGIGKRNVAYLLWGMSLVFVCMAVMLAIYPQKAMLFGLIAGILWLSLFFLFSTLTDE
jgi:UDP-GlcNAc:undecaprenyl-phosphate GlcNAc-1-phosphate transferase